MHTTVYIIEYIPSDKNKDLISCMHPQFHKQMDGCNTEAKELYSLDRANKDINSTEFLEAVGIQTVDKISMADLLCVCSTFHSFSQR